MIDLYAWDTPNGRKISVALEEMDLPYRVRPVDITKGRQHEPDFLAISPNNRIPAIVDPDGPDQAPISVFESGAILLYLGEKSGRFLPEDRRLRTAVLEWLMWQMGGFGPMPGQVHHFLGVDEKDRAYGLGALSRRDAAPLRRPGPAPGSGRVRGGCALGGGFRDPGLGLAARAPSGRPGRIPACAALVSRADGPAGRARGFAVALS